MTDMPEKINAWPSDVTPPDKTALAGSWGVKRYPAEAEAYTRDDIAWNEALDAAAKVADGVAEESADYALNGLSDNARNREAMEAAATRIAAAIRAMKREPAKIAESEND